MSRSWPMPSPNGQGSAEAAPGIIWRTATADGLVLLLKLAGVSREFAARLLALLGDLVGIGDLGTEIGKFDALDEAQARSVSEWLQLDPGYRAALRTLGGDGGDRSF